MRGRSQNGARSFDKVSVIISLDVLYDLSGEPRIIPFVKPPSSTRNDPDRFSKIARKLEKAAAIAVDAHIMFRLPREAPIYATDSAGRLVKETSDGKAFEVRVGENGEETIVAEIRRV